MEKTRKLYSLVLIREGDRILLGLKKRGFGTGKWNGFGGKLEKGETPKDSAVRELNEECGLVCDDLEHCAKLEFEFEGESQIMEVHVYRGSHYKGTPVESEEMAPKWFDLENVPYSQMWLDDTYWWPYFLRGQKFKGWFLYRGQDTILEHKIEPY